jgi:hypothetical protein
MRMATILLVLAAIAASTKLALQWRAIDQEHAQAIALRAENDVTAAPPQQDAVSNEELERLRGETRDLLKLRNQVRQLRSELPEVAKAQAENQLLRQALQSSTAPADLPSAQTPPGFTSREGLVESGLTTPEATVQSFLRAMRDGDTKRFMQCMTPEVRKREFTEAMDEDQLAKFGEKLKEEMGTFSNFRIVERKEASPDHIQLGLQASSGPSIMRLGLRKVGNDWLMDKPF